VSRVSGSSVLSPKYEVFCCDQNGPPARREEGAYLNRYVTDEQRSRRPIFIATPLGRGQLAVFPRCSLDPYDTDMGASLAP
jgi:hypothetical protein